MTSVLFVCMYLVVMSFGNDKCVIYMYLVLMSFGNDKFIVCIYLAVMSFGNDKCIVCLYVPSTHLVMMSVYFVCTSSHVI